MSKFEITVFVLVNVRSDDPEGSKGQCVTVTVENICPGLPVSTAEEGKKHHPKKLVNSDGYLSS